MVQTKVPSLRWRVLSAAVVVSYLLGGTGGRAVAEDHPPDKAPTEKGRTTRVFPLENAPAADVAAVIEESLRSEGQVPSGTASRMETIVVPDKVRNLVVVSGPAEVVRAVDALIAALDKRPRMVKAPCKLIEIGPDGKQRVLSRPVVMTLDGQEAGITVGELVPVVESGLQASHVQSGHSITLKVHLSDDDTARLEASINKQEVDKLDGGGVRLVRKSVQIIETIRLGSPVKLVVDKADNGSARSWWELIFSEVEPGLPEPRKTSPRDAVSRAKR